MSYENNDKKMESIYSKRIRAGKRRTYFFDVRATRGNDYFLTITESRKRFDDNGYDRHKIFLYKEDFNKFLNALTETINYVKTELMPDFDFDAFNHENSENYEGNSTSEKTEVHNLPFSKENNNEPPSAVNSTQPDEPEPPVSPTAEEKEEPYKNDTQHEEVDKW